MKRFRLLLSKVRSNLTLPNGAVALSFLLTSVICSVLFLLPLGPAFVLLTPCSLNVGTPNPTETAIFTANIQGSIAERCAKPDPTGSATPMPILPTGVWVLALDASKVKWEVSPLEAGASIRVIPVVATAGLGTPSAPETKAFDMTLYDILDKANKPLPVGFDVKDAAKVRVTILQTEETKATEFLQVLTSATTIYILRK